MTHMQSEVSVKIDRFMTQITIFTKKVENQKRELNVGGNLGAFSFYNKSDFDYSSIFNNLVVFYLSVAPFHVN